MTETPEKPESPLELSLQQMRAFCTVFRLGSYAAAARLTHFSTSAVWEQVKELEKQYGVSLFIRQGKNVTPTQAGHRLNDLFLPLLAGLESTQGIINETAGDGPRHITVATGVRMTIEEISRALFQFRRRYPEIQLRILHSSSREAPQMVLSGRADLALGLEPGPGYTDRSVHIEPAYKIDYLLIAPRKHPISQKSSFRFSDITRHPLIVHHKGSYSRHLVDQALHGQNLLYQADIAVESDNSAFTAACVRAGVGIGIIAGLPDGFLCQGLWVKSLAKWLGQARIAFMWKRGTTITTAVKELMETIQTALHPDK